MAEVEIRVYGPETCGLCDGTGVLTLGRPRNTSPCVSCDGRGHFMGQINLWVQYIVRGTARVTEVWKVEAWESTVP